MVRKSLQGILHHDGYQIAEHRYSNINTVVGSAVFMVQDPTLNAAEVNCIVILLVYCFPD